MHSIRYHYSTFTRKHSHLSRICSNITLITWFAVYIYSAAYMYKFLDEIFKESEKKYFKKNDEYLTDNSIDELRTILDQRGVVSSYLPHKIDLELAVNATGRITKNELEQAEYNQIEMVRMNLSINPDAIVYRNLIESNKNSILYLNSTIQHSMSTSMVFESESEFIEHVEDNKDSLWLLAVVATQQSSSLLDHEKTCASCSSNVNLPESIVTDEIWAFLTYRYSRLFGFKLGLLNCKKLHSICIDRGFIQADLILALPRSGERIKDMVQFRPLSRNSNLKFIGNPQDILNVIDYWINSILAERVHILRSLTDLDSNLMHYENLSSNKKPLNLLTSNWKWLSNYLTKRPQPINVLWIPHMKSDNQLKILEQSTIPLVLSALSVPYTGRVRFWLVNSTELISSIWNYLDHFGFSHTSSQFIIWTPTHNQFYTFGTNPEEFLHYWNLDFVLHLLYPSVDDFLWILVIVFNTLVIMNGFTELGQMITIVGFRKINHNSTFIENNEEYPNEHCRLYTTRMNLAKSIIRLAKRGWISHYPLSIWRNSDLSHLSIPLSSGSTGSNSQFNSLIFPNPPTINPSIESTLNNHSMSNNKLVWTNLLIWAKLFLGDLFSANFLILISFLPLLNLFNFIYLLPLLNVLLYILRSIILQLPLSNLYSILSKGYLNWPIFVCLTLVYILGLTIISASYYYFSDSDYYNFSNLHSPLPNWNDESHGQSNPLLSSSMRSNRLDQLSIDQLWNDLAQILVQSETEFKSSTNESDHSIIKLSQDDKWIARLNCDTDDHDYSSLMGKVFESKRLLRRLRHLYRILNRQVLNNGTVPLNLHNLSLEPIHVASNGGDDFRPITAVQIYTWYYYGESKNKWRNSNEHDGQKVKKHRLVCTKDNIKLTTNFNKCQHVCDTDYEAEDELDQSLGCDAHNRVRHRQGYTFFYRRHHFSHRIPHPIRYCSSPSSSSSSSLSSLKSLSSNSSTCLQTDIYYEPQTQDNYSDHFEDNNLNMATDRDILDTRILNKDWPLWVINCETCVVCWRKFRSGVCLGALPCGHGFHEVCICKWLDTGSLDCPVCRWPACAPHLRQQCQIVSQLIEEVQGTINKAIQHNV